MGTNRLNILETEKNGKVKIACSWNVEPSAGPRHTAFSPNGKWLGVAMEKSSELVIMNLKEKKHIMRIPAAPINDENLPADIKFSHDGKHIYLSNRGFDSIGVFSIRTEDNELILSDLKHIKTKGWPRVIDLGKNEQYLFVMNESYKDYWSGLEIFRVDETGNVLEKVMFHEMPMATAMALGGGRMIDLEVTEERLRKKDITLTAAPVLTGLGEKYQADQRKWQGIPSIEISPGGRLWAAFYTGERMKEKIILFS